MITPAERWLSLFACAIHGGAVELRIGPPDQAGVDGPDAPIAALLHALEPETPCVLALRAGDDQTAQAQVAGILAALGWRHAGTAALAPDLVAMILSPRASTLRILLAYCESIRVRARLPRLYPGARAGLAHLHAIELRAHRQMPPASEAGLSALLDAIESLRLGAGPPRPAGALHPSLCEALQALRSDDADVHDSLRCAIDCARWLAESGSLVDTDPADGTGFEASDGLLDALDSAIRRSEPSSASAALPVSGPGEPAGDIDPDIGENPDPAGSAHARSGAAPAMASRADDPQDQPQAGDDESRSSARLGIGAVDDSADEPAPSSDPHSRAMPANRLAGMTPDGGRGAIRVPEWDCHHERYLPEWCRIVEHRPRGGDPDFFRKLIRRESLLVARLRRLFGQMRAHEHRRRRVSGDGEDLDIDSLVDAFSDRQAGHAGDDIRYLRREPVRREVAVALLLDVSASTDFPLADPQAPGASVAHPPDPIEDDDPFLWSPRIFEPPDDARREAPPRRVIDLARDAAALLVQTFDSLGDHSALYAFSGSGREQVDILIAKSFDEALSPSCWQALAAIEPMRSTRMGAAIRHVLAQLSARPERSRVLIVVSDGYPDDIDYGPDRRDIEYGIQDTARALHEARRLGVRPLMVTIDRAGHDYLQRMCAGEDYRVIDEIDDLAIELARAYRLLSASA